jgi:hypothetical protein
METIQEKASEGDQNSDNESLEQPEDVLMPTDGS